VVYTMEYYSATKKNEITLFAGKWIQLEDIILSEVKSDSERQRMHVFSYMWNINPKEIYTQNNHDLITFTH
jgi:hypothetical protein